MKKYFLFLISFLLLLIVLIICILNIYIFVDKNKDKKVLEIIKDREIVIIDSSIKLPILEFDNVDYVGIINILENDILVDYKCLSYFTHQSGCLYSKEKFIILGTNLSNSFSLYKSYSIGDKVLFTNTMGILNEFKIDNILRIDSLDELNNYNNDLLIAIKNYYGFEYVVFVCSFL